MNEYDYQPPNSNAHLFALNDLEGRATMATVMVWITTAVYSALSAAAVVASWSPDTDATALEMVAAMATVILVFAFFAVFIAAGVTWARWVSRLYDNLNEIFGEFPETSRTMAVWGYIIPLVNLYAPYQFMKEAWVMTAPRERASDMIDIKIWWGLWIGSAFLSQLEQRVFDELVGVSYLVFSLIDVGLFAAGALFAARVVKALTRFQVELAAEREHAPSYPSPGNHGPNASNHPSNHSGPPHMGW